MEAQSAQTKVVRNFWIFCRNYLFLRQTGPAQRKQSKVNCFVHCPHKLFQKEHKFPQKKKNIADGLVCSHKIQIQKQQTKLLLVLKVKMQNFWLHSQCVCTCEREKSRLG